MPCDVLDDLFIADDDATGAFALDELFSDGVGGLLESDEFDDDVLADLIASVAARR